MRTLPPSVPGPDNDLSDQLEHYVNRAMQEADAFLYAFGQFGDPNRLPKTKCLVFCRGTVFMTYT
jgi:uncharacterized protein YukJ